MAKLHSPKNINKYMHLFPGYSDLFQGKIENKLSQY
jgi:hypothetical protein